VLTKIRKWAIILVLILNHQDRLMLFDDVNTQPEEEVTTPTEESAE